MEIVLIKEGILAIATTMGEGTILLVNEGANEGSDKCCVVDTEAKMVDCIDSVDKATTFNAFSEMSGMSREIWIDRLNRMLPEEQVVKINEHLSEEDMTLEKAQSIVEDYFEKGGKLATMGEHRTFGGRDYIKTAEGWKFHGKGGGTKAQSHAKGLTGIKAGEMVKVKHNGKTVDGTYHSKHSAEENYHNVMIDGVGHTKSGADIEKDHDGQAKKEKVSEFAKNTPHKRLKEVINEHKDAKIRAAAQEEIGRREAEEKVAKDKKKPGEEKIEETLSGPNKGELSTPGNIQTIEDPNGKKITGTVESTPIKKIKPSEFHALHTEENDTAKGYANGDIVEGEGTKKERSKNVGKLKNANQLPPIPISKDGYIIDGNNRFCAAMFHAKLNTMNTIKVDKTYKEYFGSDPDTANYEMKEDEFGPYFEEKTKDLDNQ